VDPDLVLEGIAAGRVVLLERGQAGVLEAVGRGGDLLGRFDLDAEVVQAGLLAGGALDQDELERRGGDGEVRVALAALGRFGAEQLGVEDDRRLQVGDALVGVFAVASLITAVLSLDATVVLLTPVVFATAARVGARPRPHVYATAHLANSASLLLPVSNLTNLLAFTASGLTFTRFAALMAPAWLAVIGIEYVVFRRFFAADLAAGARPPTPAGRGRGTGVHPGRARADAGRVRRDLLRGDQPGLGRPDRGPHPRRPGPRAAADQRA
jgi:hypothetical protein